MCRRFIGGGPCLFRLSLRVSPVAQHVPAGTVRKARDSLEEVELGRFPHRHTPKAGILQVAALRGGGDVPWYHHREFGNAVAASSS